MSRVRILLRLAGRNVVRQRRRSALIALAMMLGVALLILFLAVGDGMHAQWIDAGVRLAGGHVTVETAAFRRGAALDDRLGPGTLDGVQRALADAPVSRYVAIASPHLTVSALASSAASALPVHVTGVVPAFEKRFSILPEKLVAGRFLTESASTDALVGAGFVSRLGLSLGSRFVVTAQGNGNDVREQLLHVTGIFRTGVRDVDEGIVEVGMETARRWLAVPGAATSVAILLRESEDVPAAVATLNTRLPAGAKPFGWRQTSPELDAAVRIDNLGNYLFNGILLAIVALAVLEALLVSVLHRKREFGLMHAMGMSAWETSSVVLAEGVILAVLSGAAGMVAGFGTVWALGRTGLDLTAVFGSQLTVSGALVSPVIHPVVRLARAGQGAFVALLLGVLSAIYPMWQASRIDVAQALQSEP